MSGLAKILRSIASLKSAENHLKPQTVANIHFQETSDQKEKENTQKNHSKRVPQGFPQPQGTPQLQGTPQPQEIPRPQGTHHNPEATSLQNKSHLHGTTNLQSPTNLQNTPPQSPPPTFSFQDPCNSFVKNTFIGKKNLMEVFPYPSVITNDEKDFLKLMIDPLTKFFEGIHILDNTLPKGVKERSILKSLWEMGLFGVQLPVALGGMGLTNSQYARLSELIGMYDLSIGLTLGAHQSIGFKGLMIYGTDEQKARFLPRVTNGDLCAFCLTERNCYQDSSCIQTKAVLSPDGSHYILNGSKMWVSNGGVADIMTVFAQTPDEGRDNITAFIVEKEFGGVKDTVQVGNEGIRATNTTQVLYDNVKIPKENVLGGVGNGFKVAMNILNNGRFGVAAALSGTMKTCIQKSAEFASKKQQFGQRIDTLGGIQEKIARMAILQYVTESMAYLVAANMDKGSQHYHMEAAISKCFASDAAWYTCDESVQIMGGLGFMKESGLERIMRDLRVYRLFEGTNDILKLFIGLTGLQYAMTHYEEVQAVLRNPKKSKVIYEEAKDRFLRIFGIFYSNSLAESVHPDLAKPASLLSKNVNLFASVVEVALVKHGKRVANEHFVVNRIAQAAIDIYATAAILSRASKSLQENLPNAHHEKMMVEAWAMESYERVVKNLSEIATPKHVRNHGRYSEISRNVCSSGGVVQTNPLNV